MKLLYKFLFILPVFLVSSCELTNLDHLDSPNAVSPENAELSLFFNNVQLGFNNFYGAVSSLTQDVVRMEAMAGGNTYNNQFTPVTFNGVWNNAYANLFPDLDAIIAIADDPETGIAIYAGAAKIMKAYVLMGLVDLFGDVPFSEAGQGVVLKSPAKDGQESVYAQALALIDAAIADFGKDTPNIGNVDLYYGGDATKWMKFANTVKLKYYITTRLVDGGAAGAISALAGNVISDPADNFVFKYGTTRNNPNSRHPYYNNHYELAAGRYLSNYYMWSLDQEKGFEDPRLKYYFYNQVSTVVGIDDFTLDCKFDVNRPLHYEGDYPWCVASQDGYWGRDHGNNDGTPPDGDKKTVVGVYPFGGKFDAGEAVSVQNGGTDGGLGAGINPIMMSSFSHFMLAEAALTLGTGDAAASLETAVRQSIETVIAFGSTDPGYSSATEPTADDIDAYVTYVLDAYNAADDDGKLGVIIKEWHIASWGNGGEMLNAYRRTGHPKNMQPTRETLSGDFPRLMFYPADFVNLNANATQREITEQVFWDTNPAGFIN